MKKKLKKEEERKTVETEISEEIENKNAKSSELIVPSNELR